jgi:CHAD domain-containing protein
MRICFEINIIQSDFEGALLFELQRPFDSHCNLDTLTTEVNKKEKKCIQMLVAWKVKDYKSFIYVVLIEYAKEFTWNEDKLRRLYHENRDRLEKCDDTISDTWFMDDDAVLKTSFKLRVALEMSVFYVLIYVIVILYNRQYH